MYEPRESNLVVHLLEKRGVLEGLGGGFEVLTTGWVIFQEDGRVRELSS